MRSMGDSHIAPFDEIALDAAGRLLDDPRTHRILGGGEDARDRVLELCLLADVAELTFDVLQTENWGIYVGDKFTEVVMVRNTTLPMPDKAKKTISRLSKLHPNY